MKRIGTATRVVNKFGAGKDGFTDGDVIGGVPATDLEAALFDNMQEELASIVEGAGLVLNGAVLTQARQAIKRLAGGNVTTVNFAASPFALNADHAGLVLVDAAAGNVVITLPAANVLAGLPYAFRRTDASANTVTVNRAGADTIDEGGLSFTMAPKAGSILRSDGVSKWSAVGGVISTAGTVFFHAGNTAPIGSLKANGALISRTTYSALFAAIGTTYGAGDGATTFGLPDLRGEFLRGWDDGRGVDAGRVFGTAQAGMSEINAGVMVRVGSFGGADGTHDASGASAATGVNDLNAAPYGESATRHPETRPRNISLLACIKF